MADEKPAEAITRLAPAELVRTLRASRGTQRMGSTDSAPAFESESSRYQLVRELGRGGMGRVDEVFDQKLGRPVAQKKVLYQAGDDPAILLVAEAQTCAQLEHPSIVPVYDVGIDEDGNPAYTMRVVRGETLRRVMSGNAERPSLARLLGILRQVCLAVDYAHSRGVVHRDLKPENVIVGEFGEVYVLDWGVAHVVEGSDVRRASIESFIAGTPGYMAPEQAKGLAIDLRTDVFALGVMLYEFVAGERPFDDRDAQSIRSRLERDVESPPSTRRPGAATAFDALVLRCLARDPAKRPASARSIADAIDHFLDVEREKDQRRKDADALVLEGETALQQASALEVQSRELHKAAEDALLALPAWESAERKQPAWNQQAEANRLLAEAGVMLAQAEAAFTGALGRVAEHTRARRGLAALHLRQFLAAEAQGDAERRAQYLHLARRYDDGTFALELSDEGELIVECDRADAEIEVARYEPYGLQLRPGPSRRVGAAPLRLPSGSYLITGPSIRNPILLERAMHHRVRLHTRATAEIPPSMVLIPGGPFLAPSPKGALRFERGYLEDFAIGRFPVTVREFVRFLEALSPEERARRCPSHVRRVGPNEYRIADDWLSADASHRMSNDRALDVPVLDVTWFTASRYVEWLAKSTGLPYRLPTSLEWDKAARGADGRVFPMGNALDPSFAKVRESRPEFAQPEPVGAFELDESPYGVRDLAGGVGDWTSTMEDGKPPPNTQLEDDEVERHRAVVWRGGYWSLALLSKSPLRFTSYALSQAAWVGFRVALSLPGAGTSVELSPMTHAPTTR